jgi:predicted Zn-dependent protease with MMP-like domain
MKRDKFEEYVEEALKNIPAKFKDLLQNIAVIVEDRPSREVYRKTGASPFSTLLGHYHGIPFKHRSPYYGNVPPDVIVIYKEPIEAICHTEEQVRQKVKEVVLHEIGHYFGLKEEELRNIENN